MEHAIQRGQYIARLDQSEADRLAAQVLRFRCFQGGEGREFDRFDDHFRHLLVETQAGKLVATCRFHVLTSHQQGHQSYVSQCYDLSSLYRVGRLLEIGRFCICPTHKDVDILRVAWSALADVVDASGAHMLVGCTSFRGTDPSLYRDGFAHLRRRHLGPQALRPATLAPSRFLLPQSEPDPRAALRQIPPLLRSYLTMGGWVSDHGVIDDALGTLHVFTGIPVAGISRARLRSIRNTRD